MYRSALKGLINLTRRFSFLFFSFSFFQLLKDNMNAHPHTFSNADSAGQDLFLCFVKAAKLNNSVGKLIKKKK